MSRTRFANYHFCHGGVAIVWLLSALTALLYSGACRRGVPAVDLGPKPPNARGTLTGIVRGVEPSSGMDGRTVEVVNVETGETSTATTATNGGFTVQLPKGKYRLDVQLRPGETLVKRPGVVDLDRGDIDSHIEFVVSSVRAARRPSYRIDNGLGSPIA